MRYLPHCALLQGDCASNSGSVVYAGDLKLLHYYLGSDRVYCLQGGLLGVPLALRTVQVTCSTMIAYSVCNMCSMLIGTREHSSLVNRVNKMLA
jgi:hypothetical protein